MSSKSDRLSKEILEELNDAYLNISVRNEQLIRPLNMLNMSESDNAEELYLKFAWLLSQPRYFSFLCKAILNIEIAPFQGVILEEMWNRKFPMLIGSRGLGKSFILSLFSMLKCLLVPNYKVVIVGAAFRQSKFLHEYMENIWRNAPILRDMCEQGSGTFRDVDVCKIKINNSVTSCIPIGNGDKIRGMRSNCTITDEFDSVPREIYEVCIGGFGVVGKDPIKSMKLQAAKIVGKSLNLTEQEVEGEMGKERIANQSIISGTAGYSFGHFCEYWEKWKSIIQTRGDIRKLRENVFNGEDPPENFDWRDYSVMRIPIDLLPKGYMDEAQVANARARVNTGVYQREYGACAHKDTLITTDSGVKKIVDVEIGDRVLTHKGRFKKVIKKTCRYYNNKIININSTGCFQKLLFTPEHPFYNGYDFNPINDMENNLYLSNLKELSGLSKLDLTKISKNFITREGYIYPENNFNKTSNETIHYILSEFNNNRTVTSISKELKLSQSRVWALVKDRSRPKNALNSIIKLDYDFGICVGYYASEGSGGANGKAINFALDSHVNLRLENMIKELSSSIKKSIGFSPKYYQKKNDETVGVTINSRLAFDLFKYICPGVCYNKLIKHDILFSNEEFMKGFIVGMFNGDGHIRDEFSTLQLTNISLVNQVRLVLSYFGISCSILKVNRPKTGTMKGKVVNFSDAYKINLHGKNHVKFNKIFYNKIIEKSPRNGHVVNTIDDCSVFKLKEKNVLDFDDKVYNLEVEDDNSYSTLGATVHNCFIKDSMGFFRRSLIESCTGGELKPVELSSGNVWFDPCLKGSTNKKYVIGVDPASEADNFSIVVLEVRSDHCRLVYCWTTTRKRHIERVKMGLTDENNFYSFCARKIRDLMNVFPTSEIAMDPQGGGISIYEALHDHNQLRSGEVPIWEVIEEDKEKPSDDEQGQHIIRLCNFSKQDWVRDANHALRKDFEDKALLFPRFDPVTIGISIEQDKMLNRQFDTLEDCVLEIEELKNELCIIEQKKTDSGRDKWDTPEVKIGVGKKGRLRKDRYSALLMANMSARGIAREKAIEPYTTLGGFAEVSQNREGLRDAVLMTGPNWYTSQIKGVY